MKRIISGSVADVLSAPKWAPQWPFKAADFSRQDESADTLFYNSARFCFHVDEAAVAALTDYYTEAFKAWSKPAILDLCSSHVSHFPADISETAGRRVALGMNKEELSRNPQVDEFLVRDLNADPRLPFDDCSFDIVTNAVSMDYLAHPLEITAEVARVLRPGGAAIFALSNRCFPNKVINLWLETNDLEHVLIVGSYFHYSGKFQPPSSLEVSPHQSSAPWRDGRSTNEAYLAIVRATVDK